MTTRTERMQTPFGAVDLSFTLDGPAGLFGLAGASRFDSRDLDETVDRMLMAWPRIREDAVSSIAFARGLEYIFAKVEEIEFPELRAPEFLPVVTEVPAGSLTFTYRMLEKTGAAAVVNNMAGDLPLVSFKGKEFPSPVVTIGCAYAFSVVDVQRAAMLDVPLESMLAAACKWAIEFLSEQVACNGLPNEGVPGFTNAPGVTGTTQISTGTWLAQIRLIAAATAAAPASAVAATQGLLTDVNAMISKVFVGTQGLYDVTNMLFPLDLYSALRAVPRSPAFTNDNILDYIEALCHVTIDYWPQLNASSSTGHGRIMAYKKDPGVVSLVIPRPFTQFPPQARNLAWLVPCISELGGCMVRRPLAVTFMDGLDDTA
jgi:hypothetical protein